MKKEIKNIALVFFPINDVGGIITWNKEIMKGFDRIGVTTVYFYATAGNTYNCDPDNDVKKERYTQLAGYHLSYNEQNIKQSIAILNKFDAIIFTKSSPHPTKDNLKYKDIENWKLLYTKTTPLKVVVFHDMFWRKTNAWSADVAKHVHMCIAAQRKFIHCVNDYPTDANCIKYWDYFPIDFESINKLNLTDYKREVGMVATQWIKWKNHHKLLPMLPDIRIPIYLFGAGIEWHYLKKSDAYLQGIREDWKMSNKDFFDIGVGKLIDFKNRIGLIKHNPNSIHKMIGFVKYEQLQQFYSRALFSIDLSTKGYTNYTHFEPMCYNTLSLIERRVWDDPDNIIPEDCAMCFDLEQLPRQINWFKGKAQGFLVNPIINRTRQKAQLFVRDMDCVKVAKRIISKLQGIKD